MIARPHSKPGSLICFRRLVYDHIFASFHNSRLWRSSISFECLHNFGYQITSAYVVWQRTCTLGGIALERDGENSFELSQLSSSHVTCAKIFSWKDKVLLMITPRLFSLKTCSSIVPSSVKTWHFFWMEIESQVYGHFSKALMSFCSKMKSSRLVIVFSNFVSTYEVVYGE